MSEPTKLTIRVTEAEYVDEAESILLVGEYEQGQLRHQLHKSMFDFSGKNPKTEMEKTAKMMIGKLINIVYDPDLDGKIGDHVSIKY